MGAPVLVLKLVVDGTYLSLANRQSPTVVGVASSLPGSFPPPLNHVCVLEMEWFELTLRLCDNSQFAGDYQKVCLLTVSNVFAAKIILNSISLITHALYMYVYFSVYKSVCEIEIDNKLYTCKYNFKHSVLH